LSQDDIFTAENGPLGPIAVRDTYAIAQLARLYDESVRAHTESLARPPSFIVGRRGSGKTALLLSKEFDPQNLSIRLSTSEALNEVHQTIQVLKSRMLVPVETAAKLWSMLLWGPIAVRIAMLPEDRRDPRGHSRRLWQATRELREASCDSETPDDLVLQALTTRFLEQFNQSGRIVSLDQLATELVIGETPWSTTQTLAREIAKARRLPIFVLVDSLENLGELVDEIQATLQGLFHLVGRHDHRPGQFQIQCCFPSEMWSKVSKISSNPNKDFDARLVLQWSSRDLIHLCSTRLARFLREDYEGRFAEGFLTDPKMLVSFLPPTIINSAGVKELTTLYIFRHTQLLPRQVLHILNRVLQLAINASEPGEPPKVESAHIVDAVMDTEGLLCGEVFSAHRYRHPLAEDVATALLPALPFRFSEDHGHRAWNQCAMRHEAQLNWVQVRGMLTDLGIMGRYVRETEQYVEAEFVYTAPGRMTLSPNEEYCLHPLFVREFRSSSLPSPRRDLKGTPQKSVHPIKVQAPRQDL